MCIEHCFALSILLAPKNTVQKLSNLSISEMTSMQHTNKVKSTIAIVNSQEQSPPGEHVTTDGHQGTSIPNLVDSSELKETILKHSLLCGKNLGILVCFNLN